MGRTTPLLLVVALLGSGCGERADDGIVPLSAAQRAVFLASGTPGPDAEVLVVAQVPQARASGGAITLTGGQELEVVEPQAWRRSTGTALAVEEADRQLARMHDLDQALCALAGSTARLLEQLQTAPPPHPAPAPAPPGSRTHAASSPGVPAAAPAPPKLAPAATSRAEHQDRASARQGLALAEASNRHATALDAADDRRLASLLETQAMTRAAASGKPIDYQLALSQAQSRDWAQLRAAHEARLAQLRAQLVRDLAQLSQADAGAKLAVAPASGPDPQTRSEESHAPGY